MFRLISAASALALLSACGDGQPLFNDEIDGDETPETVDETDPNVDVNNRFAFDLERALTLNSVEYDPETDELVLNNIPFDGPDGRYDRLDTLSNGAGVYASRETQTTGQIQSYAVFLRSDVLEATAANGAEWIEFGYGGVNLNRETFGIPDSGEYVYVGVYSGVRTFDDRGGLELVAGDVEVLLDIDDLDPDGNIQGSVLGTVFNREVSPVPGARSGGEYGLPPITLARVSFDSETGTFGQDGSGVASSFGRDGDAIASGTWEGMLAGDNGQEIGGFSIIEGVAREVSVAFEVQEWELVEDVQLEVGGVIVTQQVTTTGTASGLDGVDTEGIQALVDARENIGTFEVNPDDIPEGATIVESRTETRDFTTDYNARELGIFVTDQVVPSD